MDPLNNPTPTPNPTPNPTPTPEPAMPPIEPASSPASEPSTPPPVEPSPASILTPSSPAESAPEPAAPAAAPVSSAFQSEASAGLAATDPIMTAEPPKAPDPVEEELKAPMKAAEPVPGSIGSAISGPTGAVGEANAGVNANADASVNAGEAAPALDNPFNNTPKPEAQSVAFNDPATEPQPTEPMGLQPAKAPGKFNLHDKKTLIMLIAAAAVVVVILVVVLIMMLSSGDSSSNNSAPVNNSSSQNNSSSDDSEPEVVADTLSCTRNMTTEELVLFNDAVSGTVNVSAEFEDEELSQISLIKSVVYQDEDTTSNEPVETDVHEAAAEDLTPVSAKIYSLPLDEEKEIIYDLETIQTNYEDLDFTCKLL